MSTDNAQANKTANKKSAIVGITTLVAGVLIGLTAMKYVAGKSTAMAATKSPKASTADPAPKHEGPVEWNPFQEVRNMQLHMDHGERPEKALEIYAKVKSASHLDLGLERNGQKVASDYTIR